jgi:hypothetical protein
MLGLEVLGCFLFEGLVSLLLHLFSLSQLLLFGLYHLHHIIGGNDRLHP